MISSISPILMAMSDWSDFWNVIPVSLLWQNNTVPVSSQNMFLQMKNKSTQNNTFEHVEETCVKEKSLFLKNKKKKFKVQMCFQNSWHFTKSTNLQHQLSFLASKPQSSKPNLNLTYWKKKKKKYIYIYIYIYRRNTLPLILTTSRLFTSRMNRHRLEKHYIST